MREREVGEEKKEMNEREQSKVKDDELDQGDNTEKKGVGSEDQEKGEKKYEGNEDDKKLEGMGTVTSQWEDYRPVFEAVRAHAKAEHDK